MRKRMKNIMLSIWHLIDAKDFQCNCQNKHLRTYIYVLVQALVIQFGSMCVLASLVQCVPPLARFKCHSHWMTSVSYEWIESFRIFCTFQEMQNPFQHIFLKISNVKHLKNWKYKFKQRFIDLLSFLSFCSA